MLRSATSSQPAWRREPLCLSEALPRRGRHRVPSRRALPLLRRSYGLMRQTKTLPPAPVPLADGSLQVVASPCWKMALPDVISELLVQVLGPIPRDVLLVHMPVSSQETPASHLVERVSHIASPRQAASGRGADFRGCSHSLMFRPLHSLSLPAAPTRDRTSISGGQALYTAQNSAGYPGRAAASLRTRFGQLVRLDFHQLDIQPCRLLLHHPAPP
jgi:hypothetical protein